jgi:cobalt-zinc-cadmium efflux system protein
MAEHTHDGHAHRSHAHGHSVSADTNQRRLVVVLGLIVSFMAAEVVAGIAADSLALLSDAAHMLTDAAALALSLLALRLAARPARGSITYGLKRAEILSALVNGGMLLVLGGLIVYEGIRRLIDPPRGSARPWCSSSPWPGSRSICSRPGNWPRPTARTWPSRAASSTC